MLRAAFVFTVLVALSATGVDATCSTPSCATSLSFPDEGYTADTCGSAVYRHAAAAGTRHYFHLSATGSTSGVTTDVTVYENCPSSSSFTGCDMIGSTSTSTLTDSDPVNGLWFTPESTGYVYILVIMSNPSSSCGLYFDFWRGSAGCGSHYNSWGCAGYAKSGTYSVTHYHDEDDWYVLNMPGPGSVQLHVDFDHSVHDDIDVKVYHGCAAGSCSLVASGVSITDDETISITVPDNHSHGRMFWVRVYLHCSSTCSGSTLYSVTTTRTLSWASSAGEADGGGDDGDRSSSSPSSSGSPTDDDDVGKDSGCFPGDAIVETIHGMMRIDDLVVGDSVRTPDGSFSPVWWFGHRDRTETLHTYVSLETQSGHVIAASSSHILLHNNAYSRAADVHVGDFLTVWHSENKTQGGSRVTSKSVVMKKGLFGPATVNGQLLVNGVAASSYTTNEFEHAQASTNVAIMDAISWPFRYAFELHPTWFKAFDEQVKSVSKLDMTTVHNHGITYIAHEAVRTFQITSENSRLGASMSFCLVFACLTLAFVLALATYVHPSPLVAVAILLVAGALYKFVRSHHK